MPATLADAACACGNTTFEVEFQAYVTVTVAAGKIATASAGPQYDAMDFATTLSCSGPTGCGLRLNVDTGDVEDDDANPVDGADDTADALTEAANALYDLAGNAVLALDADETAAVLAARPAPPVV